MEIDRLVDLAERFDKIESECSADGKRQCYGIGNAPVFDVYWHGKPFEGRVTVTLYNSETGYNQEWKGEITE